MILNLFIVSLSLGIVYCYFCINFPLWKKIRIIPKNLDKEGNKNEEKNVYQVNRANAAFDFKQLHKYHTTIYKNGDQFYF